MCPCLLHPPRRFGIANELEEPSKERDPVAPLQSELPRVRCQRIGKGAGRVVGPANRIGDDGRDGRWVLALRQKVRCNVRRPGDGKTSKRDRMAHRALVETDIGTARLASRRKGELVSVGGQVPDAVQRRGRSMRNSPP